MPRNDRNVGVVSDQRRPFRGLRIIVVIVADLWDALMPTPCEILPSSRMWGRVNSGPDTADKTANSAGIDFRPEHRLIGAARGCCGKVERLRVCGGLDNEVA